MRIAPRDGTHILGVLKYPSDDCGYPGFTEIREIFYRGFEGPFGPMPWHAGDSYDVHDTFFASEHYGEGLVAGWVTFPQD